MLISQDFFSDFYVKLILCFHMNLIDELKFLNTKLNMQHIKEAISFKIFYIA